MKNDFKNSTVYRIYKCDNCKYEFDIIQTISDKWKKKCPNCKKNQLFIKEAQLNMSLIIDSQIPKTVGTLAEKNTEKLSKQGKIDLKSKKKSKPFWRDKDKINYNILKNPEKYVSTGDI
jgi:putative FmdB family regulatory protein